MNPKFARTKRFFAAGTIVAALTVSVPAEATEDPCALLAGMNPRDITKAMVSFSGPVLGKHPEDWTKEDLNNLLSNAHQCDGLPAEANRRVRASKWKPEITKLKDVVLPHATRSQTVRAYFQPEWTAGTLPVCGDLLRWKRDPVWLTNNSKEIFGLSFGEMTDKQRGIALEFAAACVPVMQSILKIWKHKGNASEAFVADMRISSERDATAFAEMTELKSAYISVSWQGNQIPWAYLGENARKMVEMAERAMRENGRFSLEQMTVLSSWIETVDDAGNNGPDKAYANFIKDLISSQMFAGR